MRTSTMRHSASLASRWPPGENRCRVALTEEAWMDLRRFKALAEAGATWAEIARESGYDWRTVKRYLSADAPAGPPAPARRGPGPRLIDPYAHLIDAWLRA